MNQKSLNVTHKLISYMALGSAMLMLQGCVHPNSSQEGSSGSRIFLDSSLHSDSPPSWVQSAKISWEDGSVHRFKIEQVIRGNERVNACYDLARLSGHETVLTEMAIDIRGKIDSANTSISEDAEVMLDKIRQGHFEGRVSGLRFREQYYERSKVQDTERVTCFMLAEMSHADYLKLQRRIVDKIAEVDPDIHRAIRNSQVDFITSGLPAKSSINRNFDSTAKASTENEIVKIESQPTK